MIRGHVSFQPLLHALNFSQHQNVMKEQLKPELHTWVGLEREVIYATDNLVVELVCAQIADFPLAIVETCAPADAPGHDTMMNLYHDPSRLYLGHSGDDLEARIHRGSSRFTARLLDSEK